MLFRSDARALHIDFIDEALDHRKWAFAADVVRFYAVYTEGGVYMDSDILLYRGFDHLVPQHGFATFNESIAGEGSAFCLQAAFFMGEKGNDFCRQMVNYYRDRHFVKADGSLDETISPVIMARLAEGYGITNTATTQRLGAITVYPTHYVAPRKRYAKTAETFARHLVNHSWKKRKLGRKVEIFIKHQYHVLKFKLTKRY